MTLSKSSVRGQAQLAEGGNLMADSAIYIGCRNPVHGREQKAIEIFGESVTYWNGLREQGAIEDVQTFLLEPHGGDLSGFALLTGGAEQLAAVHGSDEFQRLVTRASLIIENLGIVRATAGDAVAGQMSMFAEQVAALG